MKAHNPSHHEAFPPEIPVTRRHTHRGDATIDARIRQDLSRLAAGMAAELGERMDALLLVGAYARGEGGFVLAGEEPCAYPGYRVLVLTGRGPAPEEQLRQIERAWSARLDIDVHLATAPTAGLTRVPPSLWWLDIARGNVDVLTGDPQLLQRLPAVDVGSIPKTACGWLLADAAASVAISRLSSDVEPLDRLRHLHCAAIACGDARVLLSGRFGGTMRARCSQLQALRPPAGLVAAYTEAIDFLGRPDAWRPSDGRDVAQWESDTLARVADWHLTFEASRIGTPPTIDGFARSRTRVYSPVAPGGLRSRVSGAMRQLLMPAPGFPYHDTPDEVMPRAAVALAYGGDRAGNRLMAARLLGLAPTGGPPSALRLVAALQRLLPELRQADAGRLFDGTFYGPA